MSLRARLLIVIAVLTVIYVATAIVVVSTQRSLLIDQTDQRLRSLPPNALFRVNGPGTGPGGRGEAGAAAVVEAENPSDTDNPFSEIFVGLVDGGGNVTTLVSGARFPVLPDIASAVVATNGAPGIVTIGGIDSSDRFRAQVTPQPSGTAWIVAAQSLAETDAAIARLVRTLWVAGAIIAVVLGLVFFWIQRLGLRPIARVTRAAEAIAAGDRDHRVEVRDGRTEAGKLGRAFNVMLDERDLQESRLRQFVADASHELRTPLTSMRGYLELYRQGAFREEAQMNDVVRRLSAESARMSGLVEDLLSLASLDERRPMRQEPVDLGQIVRDAAQDARAVQAERSITVEAPESGPTVIGDPGLITQLVGILVSNALSHTPVSAAVTLSSVPSGRHAVVTVADKGPGLDAVQAEHVFDRFWRGESSRVRSRGGGRGGGAGLGLSIARSIADAHGGTIALKTAPGEGCVFTVTLPAG